MITPIRFSPDDDGLTPLHSSGYAHVASGQSMGAVSAQSYADRRRLERSRKHVRHYGHSALGLAVGEIRPLTVNARPGATAGPQSIGRPSAGPVAPRHTFREPPARYNPYQ